MSSAHIYISMSQSPDKPYRGISRQNGMDSNTNGYNVAFQDYMAARTSHPAPYTLLCGTSFDTYAFHMATLCHTVSRKIPLSDGTGYFGAPHGRPCTFFRLKSCTADTDRPDGSCAELGGRIDVASGTDGSNQASWCRIGSEGRRR